MTSLSSGEPHRHHHVRFSVDNVMGADVEETGNHQHHHVDHHHHHHHQQPVGASHVPPPFDALPRLSEDGGDGGVAASPWSSASAFVASLHHERNAERAGDDVLRNFRKQLLLTDSTSTGVHRRKARALVAPWLSGVPLSSIPRLASDTILQGMTDSLASPSIASSTVTTSSNSCEEVRLMSAVGCVLQQPLPASYNLSKTYWGPNNTMAAEGMEGKEGGESRVVNRPHQLLEAVVRRRRWVGEVVDVNSSGRGGGVCELRGTLRRMFADSEMESSQPLASSAASTMASACFPIPRGTGVLLGWWLVSSSGTFETDSPSEASSSMVSTMAALTPGPSDSTEEAVSPLPTSPPVNTAVLALRALRDEIAAQHRTARPTAPPRREENDDAAAAAIASQRAQRQHITATLMGSASNAAHSDVAPMELADDEELVFVNGILTKQPKKKKKPPLTVKRSERAKLCSTSAANEATSAPLSLADAPPDAPPAGDTDEGAMLTSGDCAHRKRPRNDEDAASPDVAQSNTEQESDVLRLDDKRAEVERILGLLVERLKCGGDDGNGGDCGSMLLQALRVGLRPSAEC